MPFEPIYVIGGRQREDRSLLDRDDRWYGYDTGVILRVAPDGVETMVEYRSRPDTHAEGDPILFKSATRRGNRLYCCTETELVVFTLPDFQVERHISLPVFNDVHHVVPTDRNTILAAVSGMESVMEIGADDQIVNDWNVLGEDNSVVRDPDVDYRLGVNTKPHRAHPNYVYEFDGEVWATRFELRDTAPVERPQDGIALGAERVHDGVVRDPSVFFTAVDGFVVEADLRRRAVVARHDLHDPADPDAILGWCRGLHFNDDDTCWVGFSRIRATRLRQTVSWIRTRGDTPAPTRIARYGSVNYVLQDSIDLEPFGVNAVFSIVPSS